MNPTDKSDKQLAEINDIELEDRRDPRTVIAKDCQKRGTSFGTFIEKCEASVRLETSTLDNALHLATNPANPTPNAPAKAASTKKSKAQKVSYQVSSFCDAIRVYLAAGTTGMCLELEMIKAALHSSALSDCEKAELVLMGGHQHRLNVDNARPLCPHSTTNRLNDIS